MFFVFKLEVDVQLVCHIVTEKQQLYWTWGDNENNEEIVELFADEAHENTNTSIEEKI